MSVKLACQRGFTTVTLMGVLMVGGLLVLASFAAVDPDIGLSRNDQDSKQAYAAAESGLQWYLNGLQSNNNYYTECDTPPDPSPGVPAPVNQRVAQDAPAKWRALPGEQAKYTVELLPVAPATVCTSDQYSMIDRYGNMRLRISGRSRDRTRTIIATLRRLNFLDFIYFTHFETLDPVATTNPALAATVCAQFRAQRPGSPCTEIQFADQDEIQGPFHTNDNILVCGTPQFGRSATDRIEINGPTDYVSACGGSRPDYRGTKIHPAGSLDMPPSNAQLEERAVNNGIRYVGRTEIQLNGGSMLVRNRAAYGDWNQHSAALPANGVVYVATNGVCTTGYVLDQRYDNVLENDGTDPCGTVEVRGTYGEDLTIGAKHDILIEGNITRSRDDLLLGLVANNFVRVYHPVTWYGNGSCADGSGELRDLRIDAAILALTHSFLVDNWRCGSKLGDLTVDGAIAQYYRGPVGTSGSGGGTGYLKNYIYNDRLRYREPPYFLDPVRAAWRIARQTEQLPARSDLKD